MGTHKNIIAVEELSDVAGSEGITMELAECDLYQTRARRYDTVYSLAQLAK